MRKIVLLIIVLSILPVGISFGEDINGLIIIPNRYGANYFLMADQFEEFGWQITTAAVTSTVAPCPAYGGPLGCPTLTVDSLISQITDATVYDFILITSGSEYGGEACIDLMNDPGSLSFIQTAVNANVLMCAACSAVRVLAAADVIDGVRITGNASYEDEYIAAGADYAGAGVPPVIDGNIMTCVRGDYFAPNNCEAIRDAVEANVASGQARGGNND
jgi:putative intracellular protease/amidase